MWYISIISIFYFKIVNNTCRSLPTLPGLSEGYIVVINFHIQNMSWDAPVKLVHSAVCYLRTWRLKSYEGLTNIQMYLCPTLTGTIYRTPELHYFKSYEWLTNISMSTLAKTALFDLFAGSALVYSLSRLRHWWHRHVGALTYFWLVLGLFLASLQNSN